MTDDPATEIMQNMRRLLAVVSDLIKSVKYLEERVVELERRSASYGNDQGFGR